MQVLALSAEWPQELSLSSCRERRGWAQVPGGWRDSAGRGFGALLGWGQFWMSSSLRDMWEKQGGSSVRMEDRGRKQWSQTPGPAAALPHWTLPCLPVLLV